MAKRHDLSSVASGWHPWFHREMGKLTQAEQKRRLKAAATLLARSIPPIHHAEERSKYLEELMKASAELVECGKSMPHLRTSERKLVLERLNSTLSAIAVEDSTIADMVADGVANGRSH